MVYERSLQSGTGLVGDLDAGVGADVVAAAAAVDREVKYGDCVGERYSPHDPVLSSS